MSGYGFSELREVELSVENVLSRENDRTLWRYYLGVDFKLGATIAAPYRQDKTPSFSLYYSHSREKILAKDFRGDFAGDIFAYVMFIFNTDFYSALVKINLDFDMGFDYNIHKYKLWSLPRRVVTAAEFKRLDKFEANFAANNTRIEFTQRMWTEEDGNYWLPYGITGKTLVRYNVKPVHQLHVNGRLKYTYDPKNPCYAYYFPRSKHTKAYWPLAPDRKDKFLGNIVNYDPAYGGDIQGYDQCDVKGGCDDGTKALILTKSMKDCMTLHELGREAMAIHGENHRFHSDFIRHIKKYYCKIISLYDRDKGGMQGADYLWNQYQIPPFFVPEKYGSKDISDLHKEHGRSSVEEFLTIIDDSLTTD